jgi:hypothetical protein
MIQQILRRFVSMSTAMRAGLVVLSSGIAGAASAQGLAGAVSVVYGSIWSAQQRNHTVQAPAADQSEVRPVAAPKTAGDGADRSSRRIGGG